MLRVWKSFVVALLLCAVPFAMATAADAPSKDEVQARVKAAIAFYKANGKEKGLAELNKKDGQFSTGEDYVDVHDMNGVCLAHIQPALVGVNRLEQSDPNGKFVYKEIIAASKSKPSGWIDYMRKNPVDGKIEKKIAYWEIHDNLIFKAGTYEAK